MKRKLLAAAGVLAAVCAGITTVPTAQAANLVEYSQTKQADGSVLIKVADGSVPLPRTVAAVPTTSPVVWHRFLGPGQSDYCEELYACAVVPYSNGAYVFKFKDYRGYSVSNWFGQGVFINHQTQNAGARYDNASGTQLACVPAGWNYDANWTPVWRIRLSAAPC
ncbi:hypothetical protein [Kribbella sp. NPDC055071]